MGPGTVCCDTGGLLSLSTILALINEFYIKWCPTNHNRLATPLMIDNTCNMHVRTIVPFIYCAAVFTPLALLSRELVILLSALKYEK